MLKAVLRFPSLPHLVSFQAVAKAASFRIIITDLSISGTFSEEDITVAKEGFRATLISAEPIAT